MRRRYFLGVLIAAGLMFPFTSYALTDALRIRIANGPYSDETVIRFMPEATAQFNSCCDAWKLFPRDPAVPSIFTRSSAGEGLSINAFGVFTGSFSCELYLRIGASGTYSFSTTEPGTFAPSVSITMLDKKTGKVYNLRDTLKVNLIQLPEISATDTARFRLFFAEALLPQRIEAGGSLPDAFLSGTWEQLTVKLEKNGIQTMLAKDTVAQITSFTAKCAGGSIYLHWNVRNQLRDGVYIIYRSGDGQNYEVAGQKNGVGTPLPLDISYYFTDNFSSGGILHYKILHLSKDLTFISSARVSVYGSTNKTVAATKPE